VTLFGSYARGQARPDSDVDVAVVLDEIRSHAERVLPMGLAGELVVEHGLVLAPIVMSVCELALLREREDSLAANLDGEGISL
jgi:predicted nucleotidyltransferase